MEQGNKTLKDREIILKMLHEGKLTREETEMLLTALDELDESQKKSESLPVMKEREKEHQHETKSDFSGFNFNDFNWIGKEIKSTVEKVNTYIKNSLHFDSPFSMFGEKEEKIHNLQFDAAGINTINLQNTSGTIEINGENDATEIIVEATVINKTGSSENTESIIDQIEIVSSLDKGTLLLTDKFTGQRAGRSWMVNYIITTPSAVKLNITSKSGEINIENMSAGGSVSTFSGEIEIESCAGDFQTETKSGDILISTLNGECRGRSFSGDIEFEDINGDIQIQNRSGDIVINKINGNINTSSMSGDINIGTASGIIKIETKSGDITVKKTNSAIAIIKTVSGDQAIIINTPGKSEIRCVSVSGDIELTVHKGITAEISLSTVSGDIEDEFGLDQEKRNGGKSASGKVGDSEFSGKIVIETISGDISLETG
jgi:DUF4097 and DUF4098 domain-containing protein YvlB